MKRRPTTPRASRPEELADPEKTRRLLDAKVDRSGGPDACWPWLGHTSPNGHGQMYVTNAHGDQHGYSAHRLALMFAVGAVPLKPAVVLRSCNSASCCNPAHLYVGTEQDAARAREALGRGNHPRRSGEANHRAKLTAAQVEEIRATPHTYGSDAAFARRFGVTVGAVTLVRKGIRWGSTPVRRGEPAFDEADFDERGRIIRASGIQNIDEVRERFAEASMSSTEAAGCIDWVRAVGTGGYGRVTITGKNGLTSGYGAHRIAWLLAGYDAPPDGMVLKHGCDRPRCVNPQHLSVGTHAENAAEREARGRGGAEKRSGELNGRSKLTREQARAIRASAGTHAELARRYGVDPKVIRKVRSGENWRELA
ncbi:HNH endonuclease signature motif containing protein [Deinococcus fonticola]|uniref:HNH endonuclease signature motif containing protein n=1 Tax=Deinococcus fonticola TaxID=2528713 RepID=UPI001074A8A7|nr:HNH endonuclease signature motif containing protein [Deinococcus fonticola]